MLHTVFLVNSGEESVGRSVRWVGWCLGWLGWVVVVMMLPIGRVLNCICIMPLLSPFPCLLDHLPSTSFFPAISDYLPR